MQLSLVYGTAAGGRTFFDIPLFPSIQRNQIQKGLPMSSDSYSAAVKDMFKSLGIADNATEHSPRRGGSGFRFHVLGENPDYIGKFLRHEGITDTLTYIGFFDRNNSYVSEGYGSCGAENIR